MNEVFISYSRKDRAFVEKLHAALVERGRQTWVDWQDIPPTAEWLAQIYRAIEAADAFVFVISPDSVVSRVCTLEIERAVLYKKRLIPLLCKDPPEGLVHPALAAHNYIYFTDPASFNTSFDRLLSALEIDFTHAQQHTRLLVRALQWQSADHNASFLLRGKELEQAERWLAESPDKKPDTHELHTRFITTSAQVARRRQRLVSVVAAVALTLMALLTLLAVTSSVNEAQARATSDANVTLAVQAQNAEAIARATSDSSAATAIAAEATAVRTADESRSLALALLAQRVYEDGDPFLSSALALHANTLAEPPLEAERILAEIAYGSGARQRLEADGEAINSVVVSRDGRVALSASGSGSILRWDAARGEVVDIFSGHDTPVYALALSPDETLVLSGDADGVLLLWELETGEIIERLEGHEERIFTVTFSPDGRRVVSGGMPDTAFVWTLENGRRTPLVGHTAAVSGAAFTTDGRTVTTSSFDGSIRFWDAGLGDPLGTMEGATSGSIRALAMSPGGGQLATGYFDGSIVLWDTTLRQSLRFFQGHAGAVNALAYSADGELLASGGDDGTVILWDTDLGGEMLSFAPDLRRYRGHTGAVYGLSFVGDALLSGANDGALISWDIRRGALLDARDAGIGRVRDVAISADGRMTAAVGERGITTVRADGTLRTTTLSTASNCVGFVGDTGRFLVGGDDTRLTLYQSADEEDSQIARMEGHDSPILSCAVSPDGRLAVSGDQAGRVWLWDIETQRAIRPLVGHEGGVTAAAFSRDAGRVLTGGEDGSMILWDAATGAILLRFEGQHRRGDSIAGVGFGVDDAWVVSGGTDDILVIWDAATGTPLRTLRGHTGNISQIDVSRDGARIISSSYDGRIIVWDAARGVEIRRLEGSRGQVNAVRFMPDGAATVSGGDDGILYRWRVDTRAALIAWAEANLALYRFTQSDRETFPIAPFGR